MLGQICFEVKRKQRKRFENKYTWDFKVVTNFHAILSLFNSGQCVFENIPILFYFGVSGNRAH